MSIAEKLTTIDENVQKVYEAGKTAGGGNYTQGYEDGKNSVVSIERYLKTPAFTSLNIFDKAEVKLNLDNATTLENFCVVDDSANTNTTVEHITINCPNLITSMKTAFNCSHLTPDNTLKRVTLNVDTQNCNNFFRTFCYLNALETVDGKPLNLSKVTVKAYTTVFYKTDLLKEVRFVANTIPLSIDFSSATLLSNDTIQSIIDGLADLTDSTAQMLTLHANVGAKLTDEQKATITAKNWTLVY